MSLLTFTVTWMLSGGLSNLRKEGSNIFMFFPCNLDNYLRSNKFDCSCGPHGKCFKANWKLLGYKIITDLIGYG